MIVLNLQLNGIYGFNNFNINFTYPKKIINSIIEDATKFGSCLINPSFIIDKFLCKNFILFLDETSK